MTAISQMTEERATPNVMSVELALKREQAYRRKLEALCLQKQGKLGSLPRHVGMKRKAPADNLRDFPRRPQLSYSRQPFQNPPNSLVCKVCPQAFSRIDCLKRHCEGENHKAKLLWLKQNQKYGMVVDSNPLWCDVCHVAVSSADTMKAHLMGIKHVTIGRKYQL